MLYIYFLNITRAYDAEQLVGVSYSHPPLSEIMDGKNVVYRLTRGEYCQIDEWSNTRLGSFVEEVMVKWLQREVSLY